MLVLLAANLCALCATAQDASQRVCLNKKNLVYLIFDHDIVDIIYDADMVQDERPAKRRDMVGMRLLARADTAPIGCMVELEGSHLKHLWLQYSPTITPMVRIHTSEPVVMPKVDSVAATPTATWASRDEHSIRQNAQAVQHAEHDSLSLADSATIALRNAELTNVMCLKAQALLLKKATIYQLGAEKGNVSILPQSIGVDATHLYLCLEASNTSNIDYYVDIQGFQTHFKRRGLGASATGKEYIQPAGSYNEPLVIRAKVRYAYVLIYELFTLKKNQSLEFFIRETNGGRNVDVEMPSKYLYEHTYDL